MLWIRLDIPCPSSLTDIVAAIVLSETGRGPSIEVSDDEDVVQAYVPGIEATRSRERLTARLQAGGGPVAGLARRMTSVSLGEADWETAWREHFHAFRVSERLVVKPSWEPWPPPDRPSASLEGDIIIEIDPGGAFGTGSHATTQLALQALDRVVLLGQTVVDVGCGSGILGLAALGLGAGLVVAIDVDPAAVECTVGNLTRDTRHSRVLVLQTDSLSALRLTADVIVANITAEAVAEVGKGVPALLREEGRYIATGLLEASEESVAAQVSQAGLVVERTDRLDGWTCLTFVPSAQRTEPS